MLQDFLSVSDHFWTLCIKALIFGSESIPEATKYVSEIGKERDGDGKEKVTDSIQGPKYNEALYFRSSYLL